MKTFCDPSVRKQGQDLIKTAYIELALDFDIPVTPINLSILKNAIDRAVYDLGDNVSVTSRLSETVNAAGDAKEGDPW